MLLKNAQYSHCKTCKTRRKLIRDEIYGCDQCRKEIDLQQKGTSYLEAVVFNKGDETIRHHYCSWTCCLKHLRTVKSDYFVSLPYLHYDEGILAQEFFKLVKV